MSPTRAAGIERWDVAQAAEGKYWDAARQDEVELLRIMQEKAAAMRWCMKEVPACFESVGRWVEIGIGPIGVGCVHLIAAPRRELVGVDPLRPVELRAEKLSPAFRSLVAGCQSAAYRHLVGRGEHVDLPDESAALIVCYNVLDHCEDPARVVRESTRVLGRGNHLILGCDVYSTAGRIKHRVRAGLARASGVTLDSIADLAHPHQFVASDLEALVDGEGLEIVAMNNRPAEALQRLWSHAHRMLIVARKRDR